MAPARRLAGGPRGRTYWNWNCGIVGSEWSKIWTEFLIFDMRMLLGGAADGGNQILSALRCLPLGVAFALHWGCFLEGLGSPTDPPARPLLFPAAHLSLLLLLLLPGGAIQHAVLTPVLPFGGIKPPCTCTHAPIILLHASTDIYNPGPHLLSYTVTSPLHSPRSSDYC